MLTPASKQRLINATQHFLDDVLNQPAVCDCNQCFNFIEGHCTVFNSNPPTTFYLSDCESWAEDVPF